MAVNLTAPQHLAKFVKFNVFDSTDKTKLKKNPPRDDQSCRTKVSTLLKSIEVNASNPSRISPTTNEMIERVEMS